MYFFKMYTDSIANLLALFNSPFFFWENSDPHYMICALRAIYVLSYLEDCSTRSSREEHAAVVLSSIVWEAKTLSVSLSKRKSEVGSWTMRETR